MLLQDPTCARLAASHRVQQSSSSDSVLTVGLAARRHQLTPVLRANGVARLPLGLLSDLSASISLGAQLQQVLFTARHLRVRHVLIDESDDLLAQTAEVVPTRPLHKVAC